MESIFSLLATISFWSLTVYEWIIIIAILVSWLHADPSNPVVQFLNNMTYPLWNYLSQRLPKSIKLFSAYISLLLVWFLKVFVPGTFNSFGAFAADYIGFGDLPLKIAGYFLLGAGIVMQNFFFFLMFLMLIWFFMTLISPSINNPIVRTLFVLVDPFITPIQKRLPRSRIDFSPLVAAGILLLFNQFLVRRLIIFSSELANQGAALPFS